MREAAERGEPGIGEERVRAGGAVCAPVRLHDGEQGAEALARESEDFAVLLAREDAEAALLSVAAESDDALVRRAVRIALEALP